MYKKAKPLVYTLKGMTSNVDNIRGRKKLPNFKEISNILQVFLNEKMSLKREINDNLCPTYGIPNIRYSQHRQYIMSPLQLPIGQNIVNQSISDFKKLMKQDIKRQEDY